MDVALVTCAAMPGLAPDDRPLLVALRQAGLAAEPVVWEDPHVDWGAFRLIVIRSAWDYSYRLEAFLDWARAAAQQAPLWNPLPVVEWNTHKRYLVDLAGWGVSTVPTVVQPAGSAVRLEHLMAERGWDEVILKAAVAQSGRYIKRVSGDDLAAGQAHLDRLLPHEDMLIQRYIASVSVGGELSLTFVEDAFTHAVRKHATPGDFRVHEDYGGSVGVEAPEPDELAVARAALAAVEEDLLYARVDVVRDPSGVPMVMEFELVEPELFLRERAAAVEGLVEGIRRRL